jgi:CcmD family protein
MKFLYLAYIATWTIHVLYILYLTSRYRRLREDVKELEKD